MALGVVVTVVLAVSGFAWRITMNKIDNKADRNVEKAVEEIESDLDETRQIASAAFATIHGDEDRPEDNGFVVQSRKERDRLHDEMEEVKSAVDRIESEQDKHNRRMNRIIDAMADRMGIPLGKSEPGADAPAPDPDGRDGGGDRG
mgnify:CR=1 FL=1